MSPALAGGFLTTVPTGKPCPFLLLMVFFSKQKTSTSKKSNLSVFNFMFSAFFVSALRKRPQSQGHENNDLNFF